MHKQVYLAGLLVAASILACSLPAGGSTPEPTLLNPESPLPTDTPSTPPDESPTEAPPEALSVLPAALYYLNNDTGGRLQIFRLDPDGVTGHQLTSEPVEIRMYDASPLDGRLAYIVNNQLILMNADGSDRTVLVDGGLLESDLSYITNSLSHPRFSPDGRTLAYGMNGVNLYDLASGTTVNVLTNIPCAGEGFTIIEEGYSPEEFSPDGSKLLVNVFYYEAGTLGFYDLASGAFIKLSRPEGGLLCCNSQWTSDGSAVYVASSVIGMVEPGMWRFNAADGAALTLLPPTNSDGSFNFADYPLLPADGQLRFFFANLPTIPEGRTPLMLNQSAPDAVTGRMLIYPETFSAMNEALWSPDGSQIVVVEGTDANMWYGGAATLYTLSGGAPVPLVPFAQELRWGP